MRPHLGLHQQLGVVRRALLYLQDAIIHELSSHTPASRKALELRKSRIISPSKCITTEIFTFISICAFLVILILLTMKFPKNEDKDDTGGAEEAGESVAEIPVISETISDSEEGPERPTAPRISESDEACSRNDCGDGLSVQFLEEVPAVNYDLPNHSLANLSNLIDTTLSSDASSMSLREPCIYDSSERQSQAKSVTTLARAAAPGRVERPRRAARSHHQHQHQQQPSNHHHQAKATESEWLVRRTRSGQVYGRYQM